MQAELINKFPILEVSDDKIVSKMGDVTIAFEVFKKEIFTMSGDEYEQIHEGFVKALKVLPSGSIFHMQDIYMRDRYRADWTKAGDSFLKKASERFFDGRAFINHTCRVYLTRKPARRRSVSSATSGLLGGTLIPSDTLNKDRLQEFENCAGQFAHILSESAGLKLRRLTTMEMVSGHKKAGVIEEYCQLLRPGDGVLLRDIDLSDVIRIGDQSCILFSLADAEDLPTHCSPRAHYDRYCTDKTKFSIGFTAGLGLLLNCNHIYNQYIIIEDNTVVLKKMERKRLRLQSLSAYSRENVASQEAINAYLNEAIGSQRIPVRAHFNVLAWTDQPEEISEIRNKISSSIVAMDAVARQETLGAPQIWWAGIPGNEAELPENECFNTFLEQACCFLNIETNYHSDDTPGIRMGDRLTGNPVNVDFFYAPMDKSIIMNRGVFLCGASGGGKSMLCNHIFHSLYDQGAHVVIIDIGGSYKGLCELVGGQYLTYTETHPIRFNPFYLGAGERLDTEKKESLKALLVTLWKEEHETFNRSEYVALSNALQGYYSKLDKDPSLFPGFNSFYEYLQTDYSALLLDHGVKNQDFDINNFLYVLRPYYKGGEFDYLLNATENLDLLDKRFIVIELDNIKDNPILLPVTSLIITELTISKMRKIPEALKAFVIEEAWKPMMRAGMAQFIRYAWKTFRKLYGIPIIVSQEVDDLTSSPIIKEAIIGNSDIKILMDMRKFVNKFDALQGVLGMSDKGKTSLFSVNRANEPGRKYREFYLELGGQVMKVLRFEPSPEEYLAYTTERKEKEKVMEYSKLYGSMEKGIEKLVSEMGMMK